MNSLWEIRLILTITANFQKNTKTLVCNQVRLLKSRAPRFPQIQL